MREIAIKKPFREGGAWESSDNGKIEERGTWAVKIGRIHAVDDVGDAFIFELNSDGNLAVIAVENGGNRKHLPREEQLTFKRIKYQYARKEPGQTTMNVPLSIIELTGYFISIAIVTLAIGPVIINRRRK